MKKIRKVRRYKLILKKYTFQVLLILLGTMLMSIATSLFLLPNQLTSGGFSGIATITYYLFNWKMGTVILILNIPLFIIAFIRIGKEFVLKSILATIFLSTFIDFFERFGQITTDRFLACIYGGTFIGIGTSLILKATASTGGSDLVSYIIKSYKQTLSTSNLIVIFDIIVIGLNVIFLKELEIALYSAISIYIMGKVIDIVFEGIGFSKMIFIISDKYQEISNEIYKKVLRGITGISSKGMYTNENKTMLMCIANRREVIEIKQIANKIDSKSFIVITNVREVYGKGFKKAPS